MLKDQLYFWKGAEASFTKQLSEDLGLSSFLSEKFTLIPYHKSLNLRYFMKTN